MPQDNTKTVVEEETRFNACYGCAKCTSGCPVAGLMDIKPHEAMWLLQRGDVDELLAASGPWQCVGCQTCLARCPNQVDIPGALAQIRYAAVQRGMLAGAGNIPVFDTVFLDFVRRRGRVNEGLMAIRYKLRAGGLLRDWREGWNMWRTGKLKLRSASVDDTESVARLFEEAPEPQEQDE